MTNQSSTIASLDQFAGIVEELGGEDEEIEKEGLHDSACGLFR